MVTAIGMRDPKHNIPNSERVMSEQTRLIHFLEVSWKEIGSKRKEQETVGLTEVRDIVDTLSVHFLRIFWE